MKQLVGPTATITDQRDAFDVLEGLPQRATDIGEALLPYVPDVYTEGAIGWTGHAFALVELEDPETGELTGEAVIRVTDELHAEHPDGTVAELPDGRFVTVDLSAATDVSTVGEDPMFQFFGFDGSPVWVRPVRVALVLGRPDLGGSAICFPGGEDPALVFEAFADIVGALAPLLVDGLVALSAEEGDVAINPRYLLSVAAEGSGARVTMSGGRTFDVSQSLPDVLAALGA